MKMKTLQQTIQKYKGSQKTVNSQEITHICTHSVQMLMCVCVCVCVSCSVVSDCLRPHGLQPTRLLCLWDSPGKNTGVDCHSLLQRIFPTQGSSPGLLHRRQILHHLSYREVIKDYYKQLHANKMDNLEEMDTFFKNYNFPKLNQEEQKILTDPSQARKSKLKL